jgi:hypothetical protein
MNLNTAQIAQIHWDISKLLEMGVNPEFIQTINPDEIRDLLKGLLYLKARYSEDSDTSKGM